MSNFLHIDFFILLDFLRYIAKKTPVKIYTRVFHRFLFLILHLLKIDINNKTSTEYCLSIRLYHQKNLRKENRHLLQLCRLLLFLRLEEYQSYSYYQLLKVR